MTAQRYIVQRTTPEGMQYLAPPGIWQADRSKAQVFPHNEARWLAFTDSTKRKPARAVPLTQENQTP